MSSRKGDVPGVATQVNNYRGARPKFSQKHRLCTHTHTHNLYYVPSYLDFKSFKRDVGEKLLREVGKRVRVRAYKPK